MSKWVAFVFPGQGSQYQGMGLSLIDMDQKYRQVAGQASEILGFDVEDKLKSASEEELSKTNITQPLIYTINYLADMCLKDHDILPQYVAGHSLGEISALTSSGMLDFQSGLSLVKERATIMQEAAEENPGKMLAVLGMDEQVVTSILKTIKLDGVLAAANYNCPGQIVLSGSPENIEFAEMLFKEKGARRVIPLKVNGGFHSALMSKAEEKFVKVIENSDLKTPKIPVVPNASAHPTSDRDEIIEALKIQMTHPVLWTRSIENLIEIGVNIFVETGPSSVLCGLIRKIHHQIKVFNVEDEKTLKNVLGVLPA